MDGYTIGVMVRQLLASGLSGKALAILIILGGSCYLGFKALQIVASFFTNYMAGRDAQHAQLARDLKASDERRAAIDRDTAAVLATMKADIATQLAEARDTRKEMHQRFNKLQEDVTIIKGAVS